MKSLRELQNFHGKRVLVRVDFNVPVSDGKVVDAFRIAKSLPTIEYLREGGAKVMLIAHIESEEGTLLPVFDYLRERMSIEFIKNFTDAAAGDLLTRLAPAEVALFENIRNFEGEKKNDENFAKQLASWADIYVNDAFSVSHRKHASIVGLPVLLPSYAGFLFEEEVKNLSTAFSPEHPFVFILGGAKFDTKLPLVEKFLKLADTVYIGGALANDIFKIRGNEIGTSLVSEKAVDLLSISNNPKTFVPVDVRVENKIVKKLSEVTKDDKILDAGPETTKLFAEKLKGAKLVLWNGPLGQYEDGFTNETEALAKLISESGARSIVGGGDTLAAIATLGLSEKFSFLSSGGGAMLDFLANGTLPGIEALK